MKKLKTSIDYLSEKLISYEFAINKKEKTAIDIKNTKFGNSRNILFQKIPKNKDFEKIVSSGKTYVKFLKMKH